MKAATYARVSSDQQSKSSVPDQLREARAFAESQGWEVVAEFSDDAISGTDDERPGLARLMAAAEARQFDVIVCEDTDRLSRNPWVLPKITADLAFRDQALMTYDGRYDSRQSSAALVAAVQGYIGGDALAKHKQRTHRGLKGRHKVGLCAGGRRFGYVGRKIPRSDPRFDPRNPKAAQTELVVNEDEARWVRQIFAWRLAGLSCASIAAKLTEAQVLPPGAYWQKSDARRCTDWRASAVRTILRNPIYCGRYRWNASERRKVPGTSRRVKRVRPVSEWQVHDMPELAIVSAADWERVNSLFTAQPAMSAAAKRGRGPKYPLSGLLRCGCGANYTIQSRTSYACGGHHQNHATCGNGLFFARRDIEDAVQAALVGTVLRPENVAHVERTARKLIEQTMQRERAAPPRRSAEVVRLDQEIAELRLLLRGGKVRPELIAPSLHAAEERRAGLLAVRDRSSARLPEKLSVAVTRAAERMRDELAKLMHTSNPAQASTVRATVGKLVQDGRIVLRPAPDGLHLVGDLELDGAAYLAEIPAANKLVPRTGIEPVHPFG